MGKPPLLRSVQRVFRLLKRDWMGRGAFDRTDHRGPVEARRDIVGPFAGLEVSWKIDDRGEIPVAGFERDIGVEGFQRLDVLRGG